jgi:hypothetical protein
LCIPHQLPYFIEPLGMPWRNHQSDTRNLAKNLGPRSQQRPLFARFLMPL